MMDSYPCIVCDKTLTATLGIPWQPNDGVMCTTSGNYGSTVLDSISEDDPVVAFNVCDVCLCEAAAKMQLHINASKNWHEKYPGVDVPPFWFPDN